MNKKLLAFAMMCTIGLITTACSGQNTVSCDSGAEPTTVQSTTEQLEETGKSTEPSTAQPTEMETEPEKREYTAVELASMNLSEIEEIMGGDFTSGMVQLTAAFSSSGCPYIYNYDVLPGFAFATDDHGYYGISIMDGAKLNDSISSDMTYDQVAAVIGDMEGYLAGQESGPVCSNTVDGYSITFCFEDNDYLRENRSGGQISSELMREGNPRLNSIGLRKNR